MAEFYAKQTKGNANIIIIGRNKTIADEIIAAFPASPSPDVKHEFVACDASEMSNVHETAKLLLDKLRKINLLVLSTGGLTSARKDTAEGNDISVALRYYCRAKFLVELTPLLLKAKAAGEDAKAMTILAAGQPGDVDLEDLDVQKWSILKSSGACGRYNDVMVKVGCVHLSREWLLTLPYQVQSEQHPDLTYIHIYPGVTYTPNLQFHWAASLLATLAKPFLASAQTTAQYMLYPPLSPDFSSGAFYLSKNAEKLAPPASVTDDIAKKVWEHTMKVTKL
jgi:hypothetical protein